MAQTKEEKQKYHREYMRKYNATEKGKAYNRDHKKKWRDEGNRKPEKRQCSNEYREAIIDFLIERDGTLCGICGSSLLEHKISIDHIIPHALGGPNKISNYRAVHLSCNYRAGVKVRKITQGY